MQDEDYEVVDDRAGSAGSFVAGVLIGALAGVAVGMLYAPASGQSTRRRLRRKFDRLRDEAGDRVDEFGRRARRKLAEMRE
ncbi:MAG TPA: YtxH domain-containing protein [Gemmatimonadales bacterium]|jgi:gas vesicle protein